MAKKIKLYLLKKYKRQFKIQFLSIFPIEKASKVKSKDIADVSKQKLGGFRAKFENLEIFQKYFNSI